MTAAMDHDLPTTALSLAERGGPILWLITAVGLAVYALLALAALDLRGRPELAQARLKLARAGITVAPLLGLLGTVVGLVRSLEGMAGAGRAEALAGGIGQAMLTTEYGLLIAAPAALLAGVIERSAEKAAR